MEKKTAKMKILSLPAIVFGRLLISEIWVESAEIWIQMVDEWEGKWAIHKMQKQLVNKENDETELEQREWVISCEASCAVDHRKQLQQTQQRECSP